MGRGGILVAFSALVRLILKMFEVNPLPLTTFCLDQAAAADASGENQALRVERSRVKRVTRCFLSFYMFLLYSFLSINSA